MNAILTLQYMHYKLIDGSPLEGSTLLKFLVKKNEVTPDVALTCD